MGETKQKRCWNHPNQIGFWNKRWTSLWKSIQWYIFQFDKFPNRRFRKNRQETLRLTKATKTKSHFFQIHLKLGDSRRNSHCFMSCLEPTAVNTMTSPALADEFEDLLIFGQYWYDYIQFSWVSRGVRWRPFFNVWMSRTSSRSNCCFLHEVLPKASCNMDVTCKDSATRWIGAGEESMLGAKHGFKN